MDRDPSENYVDSEDRTTPTTGHSPFGDAGAERARESKKREEKRPRQDEIGGGERDIAGTRSEPGAVEPSTPLPPD
jgi:hypothetical protein